MGERRSEPNPIVNKTPCPECGYMFDFGWHGARACPRCTEQFRLETEWFVLCVEAWDAAGRPPGSIPSIPKWPRS
jgi:hypothetical protein